jgi:hypothetical protein
MDEKECLYHFYMDLGVGVAPQGLFIAKPSEVKGAIGQEINLGHILSGDREECIETLHEVNMRFLTDDPEFIKTYKELSINGGYNPLKLI